MPLEFYYLCTLTEKFDERAFLCGVQAGGHVDRFGEIGWMYLMCSSVVRGTEVPVDCLLLVFWQERAIVGYRQLGHCRLHAKSLGNFTEFTITQVRFLKVTFYRFGGYWAGKWAQGPLSIVHCSSPHLPNFVEERKIKT